MLRPRVLALPLLAMVLAMMLSRVALADGNAALAEALFREASDLFKDGKYAAACPKFAESNKLDPQRGTIANLARCHEAEGKKAAAWADYTQLLELSKLAGDQPRVQYAEKKIAELEPGLAHVQLDTDEGVRVKELSIDGSTMGAAAIGTTLPVDAGNHEVVATSEDGRSWSQRFDATDGTTTKVTLHAPPPIKKDPPIVVPPRPVEWHTPRPWQKPLAIVAGATGIAGLVVGSTLGVVVLSRKAEVDKNCVGKICNPVGFEVQNAAWAMSTGATVAFIAGTAFVAAGVVLWVTAPKPVQTGLRVGPAGVMVEGTW